MPRKAFVASAKPKEGPQAKKIVVILRNCQRFWHPLGHIHIQILNDEIPGAHNQDVMLIHASICLEYVK